MRIKIDQLRRLIKEELNQMKLSVAEPSMGPSRVPYVPVFDDEDDMGLEPELTFDEVNPDVEGPLDWDDTIQVGLEDLEDF